MLPAIITEHEAEIDALCRQFHVRRLEVFGSAATGEWDPAGSDLDFIVSWSERADRSFAAQFGLRDALASLFERDVDLIGDREYENPYFRRSVEASRTHLWGEERGNRRVNGARVNDHTGLKYLWDLQQEIGILVRRLEQLQYAEFIENRDHRDLIELGLVHIGESLRALRDSDEETFLKVTDGQEQIDRRNVLTHQYTSIDWDRVWEDIHQSIPLLSQEVDALIAELDPQERD